MTHNDAQARIKKLEDELEEMTVALSHAWDQLVPFLQDIPETSQTTQEIVAILQTISVAADCEFVGLYFFEGNRWYKYPDYLEDPTDAFLKKLKKITEQGVIDVELQVGVTIKGAVAPVISENNIIGVLGIASNNALRNFTAVDFRILDRMAERFGSQIAVEQLAGLREREALQARELQIANQIQRSVHPRTFPNSDRVEMFAFWQPAKVVGGDTWGWVHQNTRLLTWFVLDVSGKGLPAALAAVSLHTAISMALRLHLSPRETLEVVNDQFYDSYTHTGLMATVLIVALDTATGDCEVANAGHPPLLIRHEREWLRLVATAPPIGVLTELGVETQSMRLAHQDLVICYSDGFSEIEVGDKKELWGQTGLLNAVPEEARSIEEITNQIIQTSKNVGEASDDQTLVSLMFKNG